MSQQLKLLSERRFLPFFLAQFLSSLNDNIVKNALVILITYSTVQEIADKSSQFAALATGLFILPFFLFSSIAGEFGDGTRKSTLTKYLKALELLIVIPAIYGFYTHNIYILMFVLFLLGLQATFFGPIKYGVLPELLHEKEIVAGTGLVSASTFIAILLGTVVGTSLSAILKLQFGDSTANLITALIIVAFALIGYLASLAIPATSAPKQKRKITIRIFRDSWNLLQYVHSKPRIFAAICGVSWFWLLGAVFLSQMPVLVKQSLNGDEGVTSLLLGLFTIGIAFGSVLCNSMMKGQISTRLSFYGSTAVIILTIALSAYIKWYPNGLPESIFSLPTFVSDIRNTPVMLLGFGIAVAGGLHIVPLYSFIQKTADGEYRARVVAANNIMNSLFIVASSVFSILIARMGGDVISIFFLTALSGIPVLYYGNTKHSA